MILVAHSKSLSLALFCIAALASLHALADTCHPAPTPGKAQYLIGYGSLMEEASRQHTAPNSGEALPVRVQGFQRTWIATGSPAGFSTTYLGVSAKPSAVMNAVLFVVSDEADMASLDQREVSYCRSRIGSAQVTRLDAPPVPEGEIWIYVNQREHTALPSQHYPIVQSYVDIFLSGCLQVERKYRIDGFAKECLRTTHGWSKHWVNDRIYPRRPFAYQPNASAIDALLNSELPAFFQAIRIE